LAQQNFARFVDALRSGDSRAVTAVFRCYSDWLRKIIRRSIHRRVRQRYDSSDFVQSTWASMLSQRERLPELADADELGRYLVRIAFRKVHDANREAIQTKKRDMRRECALADLERGESARTAVGDRHQPRPSEIYCVRERIERLASMLAAFPHWMRDVPQRRACGESLKQIAISVGVDERTVRRKLTKLLKELCGDR
jgi:RNA polymerase sigma factor (sigma-70 family)